MTPELFQCLEVLKDKPLNKEALAKSLGNDWETSTNQARLLGWVEMWPAVMKEPDGFSYREWHYRLTIQGREALASHLKNETEQGHD